MLQVGVLLLVVAATVVGVVGIVGVAGVAKVGGTRAAVTTAPREEQEEGTGMERATLV